MLRPSEQLVLTKAPTRVRLVHITLLIGILVAAIPLRVHALGKTSYWYDEISSVLYARGQTAAIFAPPQGYFEHAPALASKPGTRSWRNVWFGFDTTPPLYPTLLRIWWHLLGEGDIAGRALSVTLSVLTIIAVFDVARMMLSPAAALWAAALCAASPPMVEYAQEARSYALLALIGVLICDIALRITRFGGSTRRYVLLWLLCAAALLTHHFVAGGIAGVAIFGLITLRGPARVAMVGAVAAAFVVELWTIPLFLNHAQSLRQGIDWLAEPRQGLFSATLFRIAWLPLDYLILPPRNSSIACIPAVVLLVLPLFLHKRNPSIMLAGLWSGGIIGLVAASDLWLGHGALHYVRYTLAAAPMVFIAFVAISQMGGRWLGHLLPALALLGALLAEPQAYADQSQIKPEVRELARDVQSHVTPGDVLVVASRPEMGLASAGLDYLAIDYYAGPLNCSAAILESPTDQATRNSIWSHSHVWLVLTSGRQIDTNAYLGPCKLTPAGNMHVFAGRLFLARPANGIN